MFLPCERIVHGFLPAVRAAVAKKLAERSLSQSEIARKLRITQPAVHKYLRGKYEPEIKALEKKAFIDNVAELIAEKIVHKHANTFLECFCKWCKGLRSAKVFCNAYCRPPASPTSCRACLGL